MQNNLIFSFSLKLIALLSIIFGLHLAVLNYLKMPLFDNKIVLSYVLNITMALTIYITLFLLKKKYKEQLGFIFLFGSALKFLVFFLFFFKSYKLDGNINKYEFAAFFIPYLICLILETYSLSKWLNKLD